ncbi:hypothetical protein [Blastococcus mobilis]|uniref:Uncharacterized protein n=1 Tax=Blastococcus mobilis TaxID=1938746 RepID=A0A238XK19_9ACTN|nr:hypothetical protein [Blastococcus mobilis]SNR59345.1 hypothetical protein SAMN06272737_11479 [Blastococcus mobilis]
MRRTRPGIVSPRALRSSAVGAVTLLVLIGCGGPVELHATIEQVLDAGPGRGSSAYRAPGVLVSHELGGAVLAHLTGVEDPPVPDGARDLEVLDAEGREVRVLTEDVDQGTAQGWGLYAVREGAGAPPHLVVEVPHPRADLWTEDVGAELFASLDAAALLVAGAHRTAGGNAADVAHQPTSAFATVDRAVVGPGTVVLQVHGFDESRHPGSAQVVLSSAESMPGTLVQELDDALEDAGFETCVYDGEQCHALAGMTNVEAAHARSVGATFIHLELAEDLRRSGPVRQRLVDVLAHVLVD